MAAKIMKKGVDCGEMRENTDPGVGRGMSWKGCDCFGDMKVARDGEAGKKIRMT